VFALQFANYMDDAGPPVGNEVHEKLLEGLSKMKTPSRTARTVRVLSHSASLILASD